MREASASGRAAAAKKESVPPGRTGARFAVRRLRRRLGEAKIVAGFWRSDPGQASDLCTVTKADFCATSFKDAVEEAKAGVDQTGTKPAAKTFA